MSTPETRSKKTFCLTVGGVSFDVKLTIAIISATLLPTLDDYHNVTLSIFKAIRLLDFAKFLQPHYAYDQLILYFFAPLLIILIIFRDNPREYGLALGHIKEGMLWTLFVCFFMTVILWFIVPHSDMKYYYGAAFEMAPSAPTATTVIPNDDQTSSISLLTYIKLFWTWFLVIFPWEFLWRGFFLFSLARVLGPGAAIFIQAMPFALLHIGKPEIETLSTIFGGAGFGFVAWRTQSCLYPIIIHYYILVFINLLASGKFG